MINRINKSYESISINNNTRKEDFKSKGVGNINNRIYEPNIDPLFIDLDRLITAAIERYLDGSMWDGFDITYPEFQNDSMDKKELKFSKEYFDIIKPLVDSAYEKKTLGDIEYHKYEEYIGQKVFGILKVVKEVIREYSLSPNNSTYDEKSLRRAADDYFMEEISESSNDDMDIESVMDQDKRIHNTAKLRIMNDRECRNILAELKALI